jgi:hypothetical protein
MKYFLNINIETSIDNKQGRVLTVKFQDNPLDNYVILPEGLRDLQYSNVIMGAIKGGLAAVG